MNTRIELEELIATWRKDLPFFRQNVPDFPDKLLAVPPSKKRMLERRIRGVRKLLETQPERAAVWRSIAEDHIVARTKKMLDLLERR